MRFLSTRTHGMIDYLTALVLIIAPWVLGFATGGPAQWVPVVIGILLAGTSMLTDYEYGVLPMIPMPGHLVLDFAAGLVLLVSPWAFGFANLVWLPHVIVGLLEIGASAVTRPVTSPDRPAALVRPSRAPLR